MVNAPVGGDGMRDAIMPGPRASRPLFCTGTPCPHPTSPASEGGWGEAGETPAVQSKSAVADFDRFIERPKLPYTRFRLTPRWQIRIPPIPMSQPRTD